MKIVSTEIHPIGSAPLTLVTTIEIKFDQVYTFSWSRQVDPDGQQRTESDDLLQRLGRIYPNKGTIRVRPEELERDVLCRSLYDWRRQTEPKLYRKNCILEAIKRLIGSSSQTLTVTLGEKVLLDIPLRLIECIWGSRHASIHLSEFDILGASIAGMSGR